MANTTHPRSGLLAAVATAFLSACAGTSATVGDSASSAADAAAAAQAERDATRSAEEQRELRTVIADLDDAATRRGALVFLARACEAPLALDVALIAHDADLATLAIAVRAAVPAGADRAAAAWPVERAAWELLAQKARDGTSAPELSGVLMRQGGAAVRSPGAIGDLLAGAHGIDELKQRLAARNRSQLEDTSPSMRLRAYEWLALRGLAPAGYDPFGSLAERRAALREQPAAAEAAATGGAP